MWGSTGLYSRSFIISHILHDITEDLQTESFLFADDTALYKSLTTDNIKTNFSNLNDDLQVINKWWKQWLVNFNPITRGECP